VKTIIFKTRKGTQFMLKSTFYKSGTLIISAITFAFAGFAGQALAATGTITETGPDSHNSVKISSKNTCEVINNNNVNASNSTNQSANSGDVDVSGNTNAGGWNSGWNDWSPSAWASHGYTYDQWHAAFMSYMASNEGNMRSNWGHMASGSATSGNASNSNSTSMNISIKNGSPAGSEGSACGGSSDGDNEGTIDTTGPDSHNGVVLGSSNTNKAKNNNGVNGANSTKQGATSGDVKANGNTNAGGAGSGAAGNGNGTGTAVDVDNGHTTPTDPGHGVSTPGATGTISNTGPDSVNKVIFNSTNNTTVTNNNNVNTANWTNQSATSGDVKANNNTTVNGGGSGAANNGNGTNQGVALQN
jgi:hypothetical protein